MVNVEVIEKIFSDVVGKCGQRLLLSANIVKAFDDFHDKYCNKSTKIEHVILTDSEGNIVYENKGDDHKVRIENREELYEKYGQLFLTHNHPRTVYYGEVVAPVCECLSDVDIQHLFYDVGGTNFTRNDKGVLIPMIKSTSCESFNGSRMTFTIGDNFKSTTWNQEMIHENTQRLMKYYQDYEEAYFNTFGEIAYKNSDKRSEFNSSDEYVDWVMKETFKEIGFFEKNPQFKKIQAEYRKYDCKLTYTFPREYHVGA